MFQMAVLSLLEFIYFNTYFLFCIYMNEILCLSFMAHWRCHLLSSVPAALRMCGPWTHWQH